MSRAYINNFQDKGKQAAIDMLLVRSSRRLFTRLILGHDVGAATGHPL